MSEKFKKDAEERMQKTLHALKDEFSKMRTSRAHPSLLEHILVSHYDTEMPLSQLASITATDSRTLTITAWDKTAIQAIEKAILKADLGLNPATTSEVIRVPMPALSEERRKEFVKIAKAEAERARVSVRNIRRDMNQDAKKDETLTEDDERRIQDLIQKLTDKYIGLIDAALEEKEKDLLEV